MKKNVLIVLLVVVLAISLAGNIVLMGPNTLPRTASIVGTYLSNDNPWEWEIAEYLVFEREGAYTRYRQFEILEEGTYEEAAAGVYSLHPDGSAAVTAQAVFTDDVVYAFDTEGMVIPFPRMSDIPTFINLEPEVIEDYQQSQKNQ